mmetsp:Transcript_9860/g.23248  ORF Transcript_9860/g.23248 Transcript_9860/m.23248 type:complete len:266 (-) Transcript_9860:369-1166(-)
MLPPWPNDRLPNKIRVVLVTSPKRNTKTQGTSGGTSLVTHGEDWNTLLPLMKADNGKGMSNEQYGQWWKKTNVKRLSFEKMLTNCAWYPCKIPLGPEIWHWLPELPMPMRFTPTLMMNPANHANSTCSKSREPNNNHIPTILLLPKRHPRQCPRSCGQQPPSKFNPIDWMPIPFPKYGIGKRPTRTRKSLSPWQLHHLLLLPTTNHAGHPPRPPLRHPLVRITTTTTKSMPLLLLLMLLLHMQRAWPKRQRDLPVAKKWPTCRQF